MACREETALKRRLAKATVRPPPLFVQAPQPPPGSGPIAGQMWVQNQYEQPPDCKTYSENTAQKRRRGYTGPYYETPPRALELQMKGRRLFCDTPIECNEEEEDKDEQDERKQSNQEDKCKQYYVEAECQVEQNLEQAAECRNVFEICEDEQDNVQVECQVERNIEQAAEGRVPELIVIEEYNKQNLPSEMKFDASKKEVYINPNINSHRCLEKPDLDSFKDSPRKPRPRKQGIPRPANLNKLHEYEERSEPSPCPHSSAHKPTRKAPEVWESEWSNPMPMCTSTPIIPKLPTVCGPKLPPSVPMRTSSRSPKVPIVSEPGLPPCNVKSRTKRRTPCPPRHNEIGPVPMPRNAAKLLKKPQPEEVREVTSTTTLGMLKTITRRTLLKFVSCGRTQIESP